MDDFIWIILWLLGGVLVFVALVGLFKLLAWWLSKHPKIERVFTVLLSGLGDVAVAGIAATVYTINRYSLHGGSKIFGMDRGAFIITTASVAGFIAGAFIAFRFSRRLLRKQNDHAA